MVDGVMAQHLGSWLIYSADNTLITFSGTLEKVCMRDRTVYSSGMDRTMINCVGAPVVLLGAQRAPRD